MNPHVNSYYAATLAEREPRPCLRGEHPADVCVVGGGLAGLSTALELARRGKSVTIVEADRIGWGASGRNGGFVTAGFAEGLDALVRRVGSTRAGELFALSLDGVRLVRQNIETLGLKQAQSIPGCLRVVRYDAEREFSALPDRLAAEFDYLVDYWPTEQVRSCLKTDTYFQGLFDREAVHIHPLAYTEGLADACETAGVSIFEGTPATSLEAGQSGHRLVTDKGAVTAEHVVLCHSAYGRGLSKRLDRALLPAATYVVTTRAEPDLIDRAITITAAVADTRRAGDYYRRLSDGRLMWGGRITTQRAEPSRLAQMLKADISAIYPQLADIHIEHAWSGLMAYARHKMPIIGPVDHGVWTATGFGGHGLNTTAVAGRIIAEAIAEGGDRYRLFDPFGMPWAGGPAGRIATQAAYWYYQVRDRLEEHRAQRKARPAGSNRQKTTAR